MGEVRIGLADSETRTGLDMKQRQKIHSTRHPRIKKDKGRLQPATAALRHRQR